MLTRNKFALLVLLAAATAGGDQREYLYLQPATAELRAEPKMSSPSAGTLNRGDRVSVVKRQDKWIEVRHGDKRGWVPTYFMTANKPVGQAELAKDIPTNLEKASRRRPPSYTVSAATRGLTGDAPKGKGSGADYKALKELEQIMPQGTSLDNFRSSAKLKAQ